MYIMNVRTGDGVSTIIVESVKSLYEMMNIFENSHSVVNYKICLSDGSAFPLKPEFAKMVDRNYSENESGVKA